MSSVFLSSQKLFYFIFIQKQIIYFNTFCVDKKIYYYLYRVNFLLYGFNTIYCPNHPRYSSPSRPPFFFLRISVLFYSATPLPTPMKKSTIFCHRFRVLNDRHKATPPAQVANPTRKVAQRTFVLDFRYCFRSTRLSFFFTQFSVLLPRPSPSHEIPFPRALLTSRPGVRSAFSASTHMCAYARIIILCTGIFFFFFSIVRFGQFATAF